MWAPWPGNVIWATLLTGSVGLSRTLPAHSAVLSNIDLQALAMLCDQNVRPHFHEPLIGTVVHKGKKVFKIRLAQVYPPALCSVWAQAICATGMDPLTATCKRSRLLLSANAQWARWLPGSFISKGSRLKNPTLLATN